MYTYVYIQAIVIIFYIGSCMGPEGSVAAKDLKQNVPHGPMANDHLCFGSSVFPCTHLKLFSASGMSYVCRICCATFRRLARGVLRLPTKAFGFWVCGSGYRLTYNTFIQTIAAVTVMIVRSSTPPPLLYMTMLRLDTAAI